MIFPLYKSRKPSIFIITDNEEKDKQMATDMTVAKTILDQMGGTRFVTMTGAKNFVGGENSLSFSLPKANHKIKKVIITLNDNDLYDISFGYINKKKLEWVEVAKEYDVYNDMLQQVFTMKTGLYTKF